MQNQDLTLTSCVQFAVIGNGFAGSDYLAIPDGVVIVDAHFLLLPRFRCGSAIDAVDAFEERLTQEMRNPRSPQEFTRVVMGDVQFELHGQVLAEGPWA